VKIIGEGISAMKRINRILNRRPSIINPTNGIKLENMKGKICFNNVSFSYPKEPNNLILNKISFELDKNKIALVG